MALRWLLLLLPISSYATNLTAAGLTPTPFADVGCAFAQSSNDPSWLWQAGKGTFYSCDMPARGDIGSMCVDSNFQPDYTSLYVDLKTARRKSGCFAWLASSCAMDFRRVQRIEFDFDVKSCGSVWAAPLWISPEPWHWPGGTSGEVDLVEACPVGSLHTNFATGGHEMSIGDPSDLGGPKHMIMSLDRSDSLLTGGTLRTEICDLGPANCKKSAYYEDFMSSVIPTRGRGQSFPYTFLSDIWNGYGGDEGWTGCGARNNPYSECQYVVKNIKVYTADQTPMFRGKCAAFNGDVVAEVVEII